MIKLIIGSLSILKDYNWVRKCNLVESNLGKDINSKHKKIKVFWDYSLNKISILCRLYISRKKNTKMKQKVRRTIRTKKAMKACHKALLKEDQELSKQSRGATPISTMQINKACCLKLQFRSWSIKKSWTASRLCL